MKKRRKERGKHPFHQQEKLPLCPRAQQVYDLCDQTLTSWEAILFETGNPGEQLKQATIHKEELLGLGIIHNHKTSLPQRSYKDPLIMVEWVAGQLVTDIEVPLVSHRRAMQIAQEFSIELRPGISLFQAQPGTLPKALHGYLFYREFIDQMRTFLSRVKP